jgi:hypothetical protein
VQLLRESSQHVTAYNEGLAVFLYDEGHSDRIRQVGPSILEGFGADDAEDPRLMGLATEGTLVVFELEGDGELSIEIAVGDRLTSEELATGRWLEPQEARLQLPTGILHVASYNTLPFDPSATDDTSRMTVAPGDYLLTLYRSDVFSYEESGVAREHAWQVITLTPDHGRTATVASAMLLFPTQSA